MRVSATGDSPASLSGRKQSFVSRTRRPLRAVFPPGSPPLAAIGRECSAPASANYSQNSFTERGKLAGVLMLRWPKRLKSFSATIFLKSTLFQTSWQGSCCASLMASQPIATLEHGCDSGGCYRSPRAARGAKRSPYHRQVSPGVSAAVAVWAHRLRLFLAMDSH